MGPHGAPYPDDYNKTPLDELLNFKIAPATDTLIQPDFFIYPGRYYVKGICCENEEQEKGEKLTFRNQHNGLFAAEEFVNGKQYLVYLDVWERHLSYVEDDYMRESALGGADTATRAQIVWQVKVIQQDKLNKNAQGKEFDTKKFGSSYDSFLKALPFAREDNKKPKLKTRARKKLDENNAPCLTAPEASYRGAENQLYRVEIHDSNSEGGQATFKWSRENGAVIFPIAEEITGQTITLEHLGRDDRFGLQKGDWVEVLDDVVVLRNKATPLLKVKAVDRENLQVTLESPKEKKDDIEIDLAKHPYLRRWDQRNNLTDGVIKLTEGSTEADWIPLEDGVEILFLRIGQDAAVYQTGDYWLIPARTATEDVKWPQDENGDPIALSPQGVEHHYAPLAIITVGGTNSTVNSTEPDLRRQLEKGWV